MSTRITASFIAAGVAVLVAGCGGSATTRTAAHHHHAAATLGPAAAATTQPVINSVQDRKACQDVRAWLPGWGPGPSARLVADESTAQGAVASDLLFFLGNLAQQSTAGFGALQHDCAVLGVNFKLPGVPPTTKCWHHFRKWQHGLVRFEVLSLENGLSNFSKYNNRNNLYAAVTFLDIAASAAKLAPTWPMPSCADPNGYWSSWLTDVRTMASDAGTPALVAAAGRLPFAVSSDAQQAQSDFHGLVSELAQTTGHHPFS